MIYFISQWNYFFLNPISPRRGEGGTVSADCAANMLTKLKNALKMKKGVQTLIRNDKKAVPGMEQFLFYSSIAASSCFSQCEEL